MFCCCCCCCRHMCNSFNGRTLADARQETSISSFVYCAIRRLMEDEKNFCTLIYWTLWEEKTTTLNISKTVYLLQTAPDVIAAAVEAHSASEQPLILKHWCSIRCPFAHQLSMQSPDPSPRSHLITSLFALAFVACVVAPLSTPPYHRVQRADPFVTYARLSF